MNDTGVRRTEALADPSAEGDVNLSPLRRAFEHEHIHDVHVPEWIAWTPLILAIVAFGLFPNLIFSITDGAATHLTRAFG